MPKINLLNRKKQQIRRKLAGEGIVYLIKTSKNNQPYYVQRIDDDTSGVVWTSVKDNAMVFHTEAGSQHFIHTHMNGRKDVELIGTRSAFA